MTFKLFSSDQSDKVKRGYNLVQHLHSEKSYKICIKTANHIGHEKLSDHIDKVRLWKYPLLNKDGEQDEFNVGTTSFDSAMQRRHKNVDD